MVPVADKQREPSVLAYVGGFLVAILLWRPRDGDRGVVAFVVVWVVAYFVLSSLPVLCASLVSMVRRRRAR